MKDQINLRMMRIIILILVFGYLIMAAKQSLAYEGYSTPPEVPGDYEGRWYGIHCPDLPKDELKGIPYGEAFPNQTIINSWGYKAKPIEEIRDLIPETYYDICTHPELWGPFRINETAYIPRDQWPGENQKLMMKFTEQNKGTARLDERGHLVVYKNGNPFPGSTKGIEIAWNFMNALCYGQSMYARFYTAITDKNGHKRYSKAEQNYFWMKGRIHGNHVPAYEPNPNNYLWLQAMGFTYPYDLRGIVILTHRYDNPDTQDDQWMYITSLRRVRRMSAAQRWDKLPGGQDITYDSATGFQGKPTNYEWEYLGRKILLCGRQAKDELQEIKDKPGGGTADQLYQRVNVLIVQYIPKIVSSVSKAVMYLDPETYACYYVEYFDRRGRSYLFYNHCWAIDNSGIMVPEGFFVADVQRIHSSNNYTYDVIFDLDAEKYGINPSYFDMQNLRNLYKGR